MKKFAYIALTMMLVLAACTKVETYPEAESRISFAVGSYVRQTKADDGGLLKELETIGATNKQFRSRAFLHADGMLDQIQNYFGDGVNILWDGTGEWAPGQDYYWPKSPKSYINFVSWYDFKEMEGSLASAPAISAGYTYDASTTRGAASLTLTDRTIEADDDILIADVAWRQNGNLASEPPYGKDGVTAGVPTLFRHALAQVAFQAEATQLEEIDSNGNKTIWTVSISNFQVTGIHTTGSLTLRNADPGAKGTAQWKAADGTSDPAWTVSGATSSLNGPASLSLTTDPQSLVARLTVLPQEVAGMAASFDYTVGTTYKNASDVVTGSSTEVVHMTGTKAIALSSFAGDVTAWGMNHRITYTISINPKSDRMLFDAVLAEWETGGNATIGVEPDVEP